MGIKAGFDRIFRDKSETTFRRFLFLVITAGLIAVFAVSYLTKTEQSIDTLREQLSGLTTRQLNIRMANRDADTAVLDRQINELRSKLASLEEAEDRRRAAAEAQKREREELAFQKRCEALKKKRISELTVNDVEMLKQCGLSIPRVPLP